ncbi:MAG: gfo/Idh/MocA family oxidoreductase [Bacteroidetes bacterium]|nr:MAG: gfo/Idh/MocA family oxidoreductase [Bacteroidota bacterium]
MPDFSPNMNRRHFVKRSALATGGLMAASLPLAGAYAGGHDTIRLALIGCGGRGTKAAVQAMATGRDVQLVAMADAYRDRLDESYRNLLLQEDTKDQIAVLEDHKFVGFDAYRDAIALADVVILATPPGFRPLHLEAAVAAGKHVFMEKPVAVDPVGIRRVLAAIRAARAKELSIVVGLQRRYSVMYAQETLPRIREGIIGDIVAAYAYWNIGFIRPPERKPGQSEMDYQMRAWYQFPWLSGDHIEDTHIHNLDIVNWVLDAYPAKARGMGGRSAPYEGHYGLLYDHHFVEYEYPNGVLLSSQCRQTNGCWFRLGESFVGTKGRLNVDLKRLMVTDHQGNKLAGYRDREDRDPQQLEHDILFDAIRKGQPNNAAEFGAYSTLTAIMGRMASYSGQEITWDQALNSDLDLSPTRYAWDADPPVLPGPDGRYPLPIPGMG